MKSNFKMIMDYPTSWWNGRWREALPLGNGIMGASVYGGVANETVMITHTDLWWKSKTPDLPVVSDVLPKIRSELLNGHAEVADRIMAETLKERGYFPNLAYPLPLCDLNIDTKTDKGFKNYSRSLDMETGETEVLWQDGDKKFIRNCFVSRADNCLALKMITADNSKFSSSVSLTLHDIEDAKIHTDDLENFLPKERESLAKNNFLYFTAQNDDKTDFGAVGRVFFEGGSLSIVGEKIILTNVTSFTVIVKVFIKGKREEDLKILEENLSTQNDSYEKLLEKHIKVYSPLFKATTLKLDEKNEGRSNEQLLLEAYKGEASSEMLEKMWNYGRYLLICASSEGGNPCQLYGLWCGDYYGEWTFNMANENIEMIYWQALTGNMPQLLLPVFDYYERLMPDFKKNAENLYGCRGIFIPGPTTPDSGLIKNVSPHLLHWTSGAGWIAQHYYDYYLFTKDKEFLRNRALPFLKEVALFYEDFFIEDNNGYYMSIPSNSPENTPSNYVGGKYFMRDSMETTINATMDFAIAKEVLTHLVEGYETLGIEDSDLDKWREMLKKIPPYQINEDGAIKEWMHPYFKDNYKHRHQSHLYPLFPGNEIHEEKQPELYKAYVVAIKKRLGIGIGQQTGWSLAHMSNVYARMKDGESSVECLDLMCRAMVMNNFMTVHNDWRKMGIGMNFQLSPVQLDANMGLTAAINEMLLQSYDDKILILPALSKRFTKGKVTNLLTRQGVAVSLEWNFEDKQIKVELLNNNEEQRLTVIAPKYINLLNGKNFKGSSEIKFPKGKTTLIFTW